MKTIIALFGFVIVLAFCPSGAHGQGVLPFDVSVGGEKAVLKNPTAIFATVNTPVGSDAPIQIHDDTDLVIVNAFACDEAGNPRDGISPAIIMLNGRSSGTLAETLDKKPLPSGFYVANIVSKGRTSRIFFIVK